MVIGEGAVVKLLVRYNGIGKPLTKDETEILLAALYNESVKNNGVALRAQVDCNRMKEENRAG